MRERFPEEDVAKLEEMLTVINDELMPELQLPPARAAVPMGEDVLEQSADASADEDTGDSAE